MTATLLTSCGPHVNLVATRSRRVEKDDGRVDAVLVESMYTTNGLHGRQMLYEVDVLDSMKRPVPAKKSGYRNAKGFVAGSRTVMAEEVTGEPSHVMVQIPINMLGIGERQLPAYARVRLTPSEEGTAPAETIIELPVRSPDVAGMGGEEYVAADGTAPTADEERLARGPEADDRDSWSDESVDRPRERHDRTSRDADTERRSDAAPSRDRDVSSGREADAPRNTDDDSTRWSPNHEPERRQETSERRNAAHDDRQPRRNASRRETPTPARDAQISPRSRELAELEATVRQSPDDLQSQMRMRLLYLAERREAEALAPTPGASPETRAQVEEYLAAILPAVRQGEIDPSRVSLSDLDRFVAESRESKRLRIPVATFCRSIQKFGAYRRYDPPVFPEGRFPRLLVYLEIQNYVSTRSQTGVYRTLLSVQQKLLNSAGVEIWSTLDQEIPDLSNGLREDFFLAIGPIDFQQNLPPDEYTFVISLRDLQGGGECAKRMSFRITEN
ncbi:MAG TPA: hypothetical protein P5081_14970 [Phycisphaerae bacterium]|nr:hypothetical protein [Phycisphaerae bacterium]HRW54172.1 hypothetical protein [Phycisphaerae bacterium]